MVWSYAVIVARLLLLLSLCSAAVCQCIGGENVLVQTLSRQVLGSDGKGVAGAQVTVLDANRKLLFRTQTDAHGKFSIPRLKASEYSWLKDNNFRVEIYATGYIRYHYTLLRTADSRKVQRLTLIASSASLCNDMKLEPEEPVP